MGIIMPNYIYLKLKFNRVSYILSGNFRKEEIRTGCFRQREQYKLRQEDKRDWGTFAEQKVIYWFSKTGRMDGVKIGISAREYLHFPIEYRSMYTYCILTVPGLHQ